MNSTERFSNRVANYVKYRPGYPPEVIAVLAAEIGLTPQAIIADIGSGTGLSAQLFLQNGNIVYGVEPNAEMRAAAEALLQSARHFQSVNGSAEATTLAAQSVDFIVAAQAFHWFDLAPTRAEWRRILKPGGWVVLLWNAHCTEANGFQVAYEDLLQRYSVDYAQVNHRNVDETRLNLFFGHNEWRLRTTTHRQVFDYEGLEGRLLSSSYAPLAGQPNYAPMLARLRKIFDEQQVKGQVTFEYLTQIFYGQFLAVAPCNDDQAT